MRAGLLSCRSQVHRTKRRRPAVRPRLLGERPAISHQSRNLLRFFFSFVVTHRGSRGVFSTPPCPTPARSSVTSSSSVRNQRDDMQLKWTWVAPSLQFHAPPCPTHAPPSATSLFSVHVPAFPGVFSSVFTAFHCPFSFFFTVLAPSFHRHLRSPLDSWWAFIGNWLIFAHRQL